MNTTTRRLLGPRLLPWTMRIDRAPAGLWLALQAAALWPTWVWMGRRLQDGSDDPLGLLAVAALAWLGWQLRHQLRQAPRLPWLAAALVGTLGATALRLAGAPPLAASLIAVLAGAAGLLAFLPDVRLQQPRVAPDSGAGSAGLVWAEGQFHPQPARTLAAPRWLPVAAAPVLGLAVLALPLLSSLQFYAGFPLRVLTAEASRWLLAPWFGVLREGSSLLVDGRLIVVDAPCSGVQMAWAGYFSACAIALAVGRGNRAFLLRLPCVGALVLAGNVLRNSLLVALEASGHAVAPWLHQSLGLALLAGVCAAIAACMAWPERHEVLLNQ